jgi:hypothetical protein
MLLIYLSLTDLLAVPPAAVQLLTNPEGIDATAPRLS